MALTAEGHDVVVAEEGTQRVPILRESGSAVWTIEAIGRASGEFNSPSGVAVDWDGNIVVADTENHRGVRAVRGDGSVARV